MIKVTMLVPTNYNSGEPVSVDYFDMLKEWYIAHFGGVTIQHDIQGLYRMADGSIAADAVVSFMVVCEKIALYELGNMASKIATGLDQESVYLEWHDVNVEFIKPNNGENKNV